VCEREDGAKKRTKLFSSHVHTYDHDRKIVNLLISRKILDVTCYHPTPTTFLTAFAGLQLLLDFGVTRLAKNEDNGKRRSVGLKSGSYKTNDFPRSNELIFIHKLLTHMRVG